MPATLAPVRRTASLLASTRPRQLFLRCVSFELVPDGIVASAAPGETPWRAVLVVEDTDTGDGRFINAGALTWRDLPLTMSYQDTIPEGYNPHGGAIAAGRIDDIVRDGTVINAEGAFTADDDGRMAADAVRTQKVRGVSVDLDMIDSRYDLEIDNDTGEIISERLTLIEGRIMGAIITPYPAFAEALIEVTGDEVAVEDTDDSRGEEEVEPIAAAASAPAVDAVRVLPRAYFANPDLDTLTPLTIGPRDAGGFRQVYGHIAPRNQCHVGFPNECITPPSSLSGYAFFHTGTVETDDGVLSVGRLTFGGLHANPSGITWREAQRHYEDLCTVGADVIAGEDEFGVWIAGVMRDVLTDDQVRMFTNASPSGDWRDVRRDGTLELIGVHQVATGGFPVPRQIAASAVMHAGQVVALIAAGVPRNATCDEDLPVEGSLEARVVMLESKFAEMAGEVSRLGAVVAAHSRFGTLSIPDSL